MSSRTIILGGTSQPPNIGVDVSPEQTTEVILGPASGGTLSRLPDVDITNIENDSVLMYKEEMQKWVATKHFESHSIEAGQY